MAQINFNLTKPRKSFSRQILSLDKPSAIDNTSLLASLQKTNPTVLNGTPDKCRALHAGGSRGTTGGGRRCDQSTRPCVSRHTQSVVPAWRCAGAAAQLPRTAPRSTSAASGPRQCCRCHHRHGPAGGAGGASIFSARYIASSAREPRGGAGPWRWPRPRRGGDEDPCGGRGRARGKEGRGGNGGRRA